MTGRALQPWSGQPYGSFTCTVIVSTLAHDARTEMQPQHSTLILGKSMEARVPGGMQCAFLCESTNHPVESDTARVSVPPKQVLLGVEVDVRPL